MSSNCCGSRAARLIRIGEEEISVSSVDAILESFYLQEWSPGDAGLRDALLEALVEAGNQIPTEQKSAVAGALVELFIHYCEANPGVAVNPSGFTKGSELGDALREK